MTGVLEERTTMNLAEFLALPEQDEHGNHFELDEGDLVILSPTGYPYGRRVVKISSYLDHRVDSTKLEVVAGEVAILMALDPKATVRGMDVAVVRKEDSPAKGMLRKPPLLIVEVISESNSPVDLERKRKQYREFGTEETWFVYEETQTIHVCSGTDPTIKVYAPPQEFYCRSLELAIDTREIFR